MTNTISTSERTFDVVLYGATGFTGRQTAAYFRDHAPAEVRWAIAGRNEAKLGTVASELGLSSAVGVLVADSSDRGAVSAMTAATRVLLSTAGPFSLYGSLVVECCVLSGTHYVDITGETTWVRGLIDAWHDKAAAEGTRIIPFCGFDSVPSDLGAWMVCQAIRQQTGGGTRSVRASAKLGGGGLNGGTLASALQAGESGNLAALADVLLLNPADQRSPQEAERSPDWHGVKFDKDLKCYLTPFVMAAVNTRVVRRSRALLAQGEGNYGGEFAYAECMETSKKHVAWMTALGLGVVGTLLASGPGRSLLRRVGPAPGAGPSEEAMDAGWFRLRMVAEAEDGSRYLGTIKGQGDAGNRSTVRMVCESALTLACDGDQLPGGPNLGGILTPATGLGGALLSRLRATGKMDWEVEALGAGA
ncbi:MAG: saccharopine dehydrogenase NADP-binding domain-containing protein [Myxococcales bacterium]|nr:saccharopine dehydrogenase NADP-binding domain-containing protein [Myxococcales bacterium]